MYRWRHCSLRLRRIGFVFCSPCLQEKYIYIYKFFIFFGRHQGQGKKDEFSREKYLIFLSERPLSPEVIPDLPTIAWPFWLNINNIMREHNVWSYKYIYVRILCLPKWSSVFPLLLMLRWASRKPTITHEVSCNSMTLKDRREWSEIYPQKVGWIFKTSWFISNVISCHAIFALIIFFQPLGKNYTLKITRLCT